MPRWCGASWPDFPSAPRLLRKTSVLGAALTLVRLAALALGSPHVIEQSLVHPRLPAGAALAEPLDHLAIEPDRHQRLGLAGLRAADLAGTDQLVTLVEIGPFDEAVDLLVGHLRHVIRVNRRLFGNGAFHGHWFSKRFL